MGEVSHFGQLGLLHAYKWNAAIFAKHKKCTCASVSTSSEVDHLGCFSLINLLCHTSPETMFFCHVRLDKSPPVRWYDGLWAGDAGVVRLVPGNIKCESRELTSTE